MEKITICQIKKTTVEVTEFRKNLSVEKRATYTCSPNVYTEFFTMLRSKLKIQRVRFLLPEEDTYVKLLLFPKGAVITRQQIIQKAQEMIPETIEDGCMDWKQVSLPGGLVGVQIYVVKKSVIVPLFLGAESSGIIIESCEPPSFAMARLTTSLPEPFLLAYPTAKPEFVCAVQGGNVLEVMSIGRGESLNTVKQAFVAYVAKQWGVVVRSIVTNMPDPVLGLASKTDFQGADSDVLNIPPDVEISKKHSLAIRTGMFAILFMSIVGAVYYYLTRLLP